MSSYVVPHDYVRRFWRLRLFWFNVQWNVRDTIAGMLQDLARWIAP